MSSYVPDVLEMTFLPAGEPGALWHGRVYVQFADGCRAAFPEGHKVTVAAALEHHTAMHATGGDKT